MKAPKNHSHNFEQQLSNNQRYLATEISNFQLLEVLAVAVWILISWPRSCCLENILPSHLCTFCFLVVVLRRRNIRKSIVLPLLRIPL